MAETDPLSPATHRLIDRESRTGPFVFVAAVIAACLVAGVVLASFDTGNAPALVISVLLACAVATLLYGILGGVSSAGFNLGPIKMGGSAAVLLASIWFFNGELHAQLQEIRKPDSFDLREHATPAGGWFAIDERTAVPIDVTFKDPAMSGNDQVVKAPSPARLPLMLVRTGRDNMAFVVGEGEATNRSIGQVSLESVAPPQRPRRSLSPTMVYGPTRLHLVNEGKLAETTPREWGSSGTCLGRRLPMRLRVRIFAEGYADYEIYPCGASEDSPAHVSSLAPRQAEPVNLTINGRQRHFLVAVLAADHRQAPFWSSFVVMELEEAAGR